MTLAALSVTSEPILEIAADVLVIGVRKTDDGPQIASEVPELLALQESLALIGITGAQDEVRRLPFDGVAGSLALVGLGAGPIGTIELRYAAGSVARQILGIEHIVLALPTSNDDELTAVLEGAAIGSYAYTTHRADSLAATKLPASIITVVGVADDETTVIARAAAVASAVHSVRDLVNAPPSHLYPQTLAQAAADLAKGTDVTVTVLDEKALAEGGFGGILAVGSGSARPPRLVKAVYSPAGATKHIALVGKGITFDTGGLSLKPPVSMVGMKYDMTGAATALAVVIAASALAIPVKITAWLCIAENMPSGTATRPNDVFTIRGGKTVENLNSDAEGRLVMADGLVAASEEEPDAIIDIATLTGAARVALGNRYVGSMGDSELVKRVIDAGKTVGEPFWHMPLPSELRALLNSDVADIANVKPGNTAAGMLVAGVFLQEFVGMTGEGDERHRIPWAHLDIAGPANNDGGAYGYTGKGPTAVTVRTLLALAEEFSRP